MFKKSALSFPHIFDARFPGLTFTMYCFLSMMISIFFCFVFVQFILHVRIMPYQHNQTRFCTLSQLCRLPSEIGVFFAVLFISLFSSPQLSGLTFCISYFSSAFAKVFLNTLAVLCKHKTEMLTISFFILSVFC